jgi:hypothetical protein
VRLWNRTIDEIIKKTQETHGFFARNPFGPVALMLNNLDGKRSNQLIHTTKTEYKAYLESLDDTPEPEFRAKAVAANRAKRREEKEPDHDVAAGKLELSHGCIHIRYLDLCEMIEQGYAAQGVQIRVHSYSEHDPKLRSMKELLD